MGKQIRLTPVGRPQGFTIVETLIVLAVSGFMLLSIMGVISGKQHIAEFQTSLNDLRTQMEQISNQVVNGEFPDQKFGCQKGSFHGLPAPIMSTTDLSSSNSGDCVFIGKAVHFCQQSNCLNDDGYAVYSMVGLRNDGATYTPTGVSPFLAAKTNDSGGYDAVSGGVGDGITTTSALENGLGVKKISYSLNGSVAGSGIGSFGFVQSLNGDLSSGSLGGGQHSKLMVFPSATSSLTNSIDQEALSIDKSLFASQANTDDSLAVTVCLKSGSTNQWAKMTLTNQGSQLDINTQITDTDCST